MPDLRQLALLVLAACWAETAPPPAAPTPAPAKPRTERVDRPTFEMNPIEGWHCVETAVPDKRVECMKSAFDCEGLRTTMAQHGMTPGECREQPLAWCVTFRRLRKQPRWTHVCTSTPADCTTVRTKLLLPAAQADGVSECNSWR